MARRPLGSTRSVKGSGSRDNRDSAGELGTVARCAPAPLSAFILLDIEHMFDYPGPPMASFAALRDALDVRFRTASPDAFVQPDGTVLATGIASIDRALAGGFPKGAISTLEGSPSSGRSALAARALAVATCSGGAAALVESHADASGFVFPPSLEDAGIALGRLAIVRVHSPLEVIRATDILL